jgi:hypothetical protein
MVNTLQLTGSLFCQNTSDVASIGATGAEPQLEFQNMYIDNLYWNSLSKIYTISHISDQKMKRNSVNLIDLV